MRRQMMEMIQTDKDLKQFLRVQPVWYRRLARNPLEFEAFQYASKQYFQKTLPQKMDRIANSIEFATMMLQMFEAMKSND